MKNLALEVATFAGGLVAMIQLGFWVHRFTRRYGVSAEVYRLIAVHVFGTLIMAVPTTAVLIYLPVVLLEMLRDLVALIYRVLPLEVLVVEQSSLKDFHILGWCSSNRLLTGLVFLASLLLIQGYVIPTRGEYPHRPLATYWDLLSVPLILSAVGVALYLLLGAGLQLFDVEILSAKSALSIAVGIFLCLWFFIIID